MSTSIELHNVVAVQINDTVVAKNTTTTWRELHFHKVNGERYAHALSASKGKFNTCYFW
jgi:hypothetical protein